MAWCPIPHSVSQGPGPLSWTLGPITKGRRFFPGLKEPPVGGDLVAVACHSLDAFRLELRSFPNGSQGRQTSGPSAGPLAVELAWCGPQVGSSSCCTPHNGGAWGEGVW